MNIAEDIKAKRFTIDADEFAFVLANIKIEKHAPGKHDQKTHAGGKDSHPRYDGSLDSANLEHYTGEGYEEINRFLRTGKADPTGEEPDELREYISSLDRIIKKTSTPEDMVVYRGITGASKLQTLKEGDVFRDRGFASTSTERETVGMFMDSAARGLNDTRPIEKGAVLEISVPQGSRALSVDKYFEGVDERFGPSAQIRSENEYILPRGASFRVDSIGTINVRGVEDKLIKVTMVDNDK